MAHTPHNLGPQCQVSSCIHLDQTPLCPEQRTKWCGACVASVAAADCGGLCPALPPAGTNYSATQLWGPPKLPLGGLWRPWARMDRGSVNSVPLARHQALIDANFHADQFGTVLRNGTGAWSGQLSIDTAALTPGWHKLTLQVRAGRGQAGEQGVPSIPQCAAGWVSRLTQSSPQLREAASEACTPHSNCPLNRYVCQPRPQTPQAKARDPATGATNTGSLAVQFEASGAP